MNNQNLTKVNYVSGKTAKTLLEVSDNTLRRWANEGKIDFIRNNEKGKRFYNVNSIITDSSFSSEVTNLKREYCYCRVSSNSQKNDLERQVEFMQSKFPTSIIIKDIGSGINWKRRGLLSLIQQVKNGKVERVNIAFKDRLCRFAYELIEFFFKLYQVEILVLDQGKESKSPDIELSEDILAIIHVFSCKKMGQRSYRK
jgi:putative resolvase